MTPLNINKAPVIKADEEDQMQLDLFDARNNIKEIGEVGMQAVSDLSRIAAQSQRPYDFMALSAVMKTTLDSQKELLDVHRTRKEFNRDVPPAGDTINNNLFVGTTAELQELLQKAKND